MTMKAVLAGAVLAIGVLAAPASAATYTDTLQSEFNHDGEAPFPSPELNVGTFLYLIEAGETIVLATVSGTFGNLIASNSAPVRLFGDSSFLGECIEPTVCTSSSTVTAFSFAVTNLLDLLDGAYLLSIFQTSEDITRLGDLTLTIETRASEVPLPAALLLGGLAGLGALGARRRKTA